MNEKGYKNTYTLKNGQELIVRQPIADDAVVLINLIKKADSESRFLAREPGEFDVSEEIEREMIESKLVSDSMRWFVAEYKGDIVGQCSVGLVNRFKRYRHRAGVALLVRKEFWGLGIGGRLMAECISWCKDNNIEQLELTVVSENTRAKKMYESFGFITTGTQIRSLKYTNGTYADELIMMLKF